VKQQWIGCYVQIHTEPRTVIKTTEPMHTPLTLRSALEFVDLE